MHDQSRLDAAMPVVGPIVLAVVKAHRGASDPQQLDYLNVVLECMCRQMEKFVKPHVSRNARLQADKMGLELGKLAWRRQRTVDEGRKTFHLDHVVTVATM